MSKLLSDLAKGTWSGVTAYTIGDIVDYLSSSYICIANNTNQTPPNASYWTLLSSGIEWKGTWSAGTYTKNQAVVNNGTAYIVNKSSTTETPSNAAVDWDILASKGDTGSTGATGATGATGPTGTDGVSAGLAYTFDTTTTDSDPGNGNIRFNNATLASVTELFMDNLENLGGDVSSFIDTWDDSTNSALRGIVIIRKVSDKTKFAIFSVTGSVVDGTGYRKVTVTYITSNGTFSASDSLSVEFARTGNKGADGAGSGDVTGPGVAVTDGAIVLWNTTSGQSIKDSTTVPTTVGTNLIKLTNPSAITFLRVNADNSVSALSASAFLTAIGGAAKGANSDITSLSGLSTPLSVAQGGTGAATLTGILKGNGAGAFTAVTAPTGVIVGDTDTQTLTNKTLTSPKIGTSILDTNGNTLISITATGSAVNGLSWTNAATGGNPKLAAAGSDTDITLDIAGKGAKGVRIQKAAPKVFALTDGATISVDASLGNLATLTLSASGHTIANPTNASEDGQILVFRITQDATGSRTVSWGTNYNFGTSGTPTLTTTASKSDYVGFRYNATSTKWDYMGSQLGY